MRGKEKDIKVWKNESKLRRGREERKNRGEKMGMREGEMREEERGEERRGERRGRIEERKWG